MKIEGKAKGGIISPGDGLVFLDDREPCICGGNCVRGFCKLEPILTFNVGCSPEKRSFEPTFRYVGGSSFLNTDRWLPDRWGKTATKITGTPYIVKNVFGETTHNVGLRFIGGATCYEVDDCNQFDINTTEKVYVIETVLHWNRLDTDTNRYLITKSSTEGGWRYQQYLDAMYLIIQDNLKSPPGYAQTNPFSYTDKTNRGTWNHQISFIKLNAGANAQIFTCFNGAGLVTSVTFPDGTDRIFKTASTSAKMRFGHATTSCKGIIGYISGWEIPASVLTNLDDRKLHTMCMDRFYALVGIKPQRSKGSYYPSFPYVVGRGQTNATYSRVIDDAGKIELHGINGWWPKIDMFKDVSNNIGTWYFPEGGVTNALVPSYYHDSSWYKNGVTSVYSEASPYYNPETAGLFKNVITESSANEIHAIGKLSVTTVVDTYYTYQVMFRLPDTGGRRYFAIYYYNASHNGYFIIDTQTWVKHSSYDSVSTAIRCEGIEGPFKDDYYHIYLTFLARYTSYDVYGPYFLDTASIGAYQGDGRNLGYIWQHQLIAAWLPAEFVRTYDTAVSRLVENLSWNTVKQNYCNASEDLINQGVWVRSKLTPSEVTGSVTPPKDVTRVFKLTEDATNGEHYLEQWIAGYVREALCFAVRVKPIDRDYYVLTFFTSGGGMQGGYLFDFNSDPPKYVITDRWSTSIRNVDIVKQNDGWYLIYISHFTITQSTPIYSAWRIRFSLASSAGYTTPYTYTGDSRDACYLTGVEVTNSVEYVYPYLKVDNTNLLARTEWPRNNTWWWIAGSGLADNFCADPLYGISRNYLTYTEGTATSSHIAYIGYATGYTPLSRCFVIASQTYTFKILLKKTDNNRYQFRVANMTVTGAYVDIDVDALTISKGDPAVVTRCAISSLNFENWYSVDFSYIAAATGLTYFGVYGKKNGAVSYTGESLIYVGLFAPQLNVGSTALTYQPKKFGTGRVLPLLMSINGGFDYEIYEKQGYARLNNIVIVGCSTEMTILDWGVRQMMGFGSVSKEGRIYTAIYGSSGDADYELLSHTTFLSKNTPVPVSVRTKPGEYLSNVEGDIKSSSDYNLNQTAFVFGIGGVIYPTYSGGPYCGFRRLRLKY